MMPYNAMVILSIRALFKIVIRIDGKTNSNLIRYLGRKVSYNIISSSRKRRSVPMKIYRQILAQKNLFEILLNQPEIRLYLPFSCWFGSKRTSVWFQINRNSMVNTIWFRVDFEKISLCQNLSTNSSDNSQVSRSLNELP